MAWFRRRTQDTSVRPPRGSGTGCDSCSAPLDPAAGYAVATRDVAMSQAYWQHSFRTSVRRLAGLGIATDPAYFVESLRFVAGQGTRG